MDYFNKDTIIYKTGQSLLNHFGECVYGYQNKDENQLLLTYWYNENRLSSPIFFLDKTASYHLLVSSNYKAYAGRLYDDVNFLKGLSDQLD